MKHTIPKLVYADAQGQIYDHPFLTMAGMSGPQTVLPETIELIPLPEGSRLFTIPDTPPIAWDSRKRGFVTVEKAPGIRGNIQAVSAFMAPGYARTLLPACDYRKKTVHLPLWSYTAVGWDEAQDCFVVAATKVDNNTNWNPENYDDRLLDPLVRKRLKELPNNRLLEQLARCAIDYHCFAAKNLFFQRWEAPLPTSPTCNAACLGCISLQASDYCPANQDRINFVPTPEEIVELALPHLEQADQAIVSYGQGCEGDPILQTPTIVKATRRLKQATQRGTINFNSNGSLPDRVQELCDAGMDSFRFSLNSVLEERYNAYYRPRGYRFQDVLHSLKLSKQAGRFTMVNYLISPGVTDAPEEVVALKQFVADTGVDMLQLRNLSIDPDLYNQALKVTDRGIGLYRLLIELKQDFPRLQFGYYNRTRENFFPPGFETGWPIRG
jgi:pyruvate-formate lyase-activating enzyme